MSNKNKLSIYMIKDEYKEEKEIIKLSQVIDSQSLKDIGKVYIGKSEQTVPKWIHEFFLDRIASSFLFSANSRAVLLAEIKVKKDVIKRFAITFGYGKFMLKDDVIEERFGIKVLLNTIKPNSLRKINKRNIGGNQKLSNEQMPAASEITEFDLDFDRDLINGLTGISSDKKYVSGMMVGSDILNITGEIDVNNIVKFLKMTYKQYKSIAYRENFAWIDRIKEVRGKLIGELNNQLIELINNKDQSVWLAVPEIIEWDQISGFHYGKSNLEDDIYIDLFVNSFNDGIQSIDQLKHRNVEAMSIIEETIYKSWSVYKCLFGEITYKNHEYCINGGKWYQIDKTFMKEVNKEYSETKVSGTIFHPYPTTNTGEKYTENTYNEEFVKNNSSKYILMDCQFIQYGGGANKLELCDILSDAKALIHVKKNSGSSALSHLFFQGTVSAELIKSEPKFRDKANEIIQTINAGKAYQLTENDKLTIVFAIISDKKKDANSQRPQIPFFSRVSFLQAKRRLTLMGYDVCINKISVEHDLKK